ncbi:AAA family ATPase [Candidatus Micrarchaeota archaeon]|nr:AAA family ATPase [Candidatus Micrarchaeota archaeon]
MTSFGEILSRKGVFKDKGILSPHYVPESLLFREDEIKRIMFCVAPALKGAKSKNLFIYGKTGTGKTASTKYVITKLNEEKNERVKQVYMNCRVYDTRYRVLQKAISEFQLDIAKTGYAFALLYEKMLDWIEGSDNVQGKQLILILDEVDMVKDLDNLVYTLTRANDDLKAGNVSIIGISNKVNFKQRLDVRSRSSLCEEELVFQPYDAEQLKGILEQRIGGAFEEGIVGESAINLAAAIAARENGDARYALTLLLRAGELAETMKLDKVTDEEVERARKIADEDKAVEVISSLPEHQQMVLYALASISSDSEYKKLVEEGGDRFYFSGEIYERYCSHIKKLGKEPVSSRWYREYLDELTNLGLIAAVQSGKGIRGHTTLIKLAYDAPKVRKVVEKTLMAD